MLSEWMFEGFWYFLNEDGLLPRAEIEELKFEEIWGKLGPEFKSKFLTMLRIASCVSVLHYDFKLSRLQTKSNFDTWLCCSKEHKPRVVERMSPTGGFHVDKVTATVWQNSVLLRICRGQGKI